jgi:hypothetical protein
MQAAFAQDVALTEQLPPSYEGLEDHVGQIRACVQDLSHGLG